MPILLTVEEAPSKALHMLPRVIPKEARKERMVEKVAKEARPEKVAKTHLVAAKVVERRASLVGKTVEKARPITNSKVLTNHRSRVKVMHGGIIVSVRLLERVRILIAFQVAKGCLIGPLNT